MAERFKVGESYWRPCAEITTLCDGKIFYIPVHDHLHSDVQFDFPHEHYHIDGRFYMEPRMKQKFECWDGYTNKVIIPDDASDYSFMCITEVLVKCERLETGLKIPDNPTELQASKLERYNNWYNSYLGKSCQGRKCPHFGTAMLKIKGKLVCPMHGITCDVVSLEVIHRQETPGCEA